MDNPPPKPPRTKSKAEQAKNPVRQVQPPKPPMKKKKIVRRPKGTGARIEKEVAEKLAKAKADKKKSKIDFNKVEEASSFLSGNDFIYDFEDFMTNSELSARTETAQMKAFERASARLNKAIEKRLKQIAKEKKFKTTEEFVKFIKTIKTAKAMRELMDL